MNVNNGEGTHLASKVLIAHQKVILLTFKCRFFIFFTFCKVQHCFVLMYKAARVFQIHRIYMIYTNDDCWIKVTSFPPCINKLLQFLLNANHPFFAINRNERI